MSANPPKSREFCIIGDDGEPDDLALHAGILDDPELTERLKRQDAAREPGKAANKDDDEDTSDLDEYDDLIE